MQSIKLRTVDFLHYSVPRWQHSKDIYACVSRLLGQSLTSIDQKVTYNVKGSNIIAFLIVLEHWAFIKNYY